MKRFATTLLTVSLLSIMLDSVAIADRLERERQMKECTENLRAIGVAIEAYKADHQGELPDWLSDLYPKYLKDRQTLLCPADKAKGFPAGSEAYKDPKMPCSYIYEFNPMKYLGERGLFELNIPKDLTYKELKKIQLRYFGGLVPVVQCRHHGTTPGVRVMNFSYDGRIYASSGGWQYQPEAIRSVLSSIQNAIEQNPDGWEKQLSVKEIYGYFGGGYSGGKRLPDFCAVLEKQSNLSADALKILAEIYTSEGKIDETIGIYDRLMRLAPSDTDARFQLAKLYAMVGNYPAARDQCRQIIQSVPDHAKAHSLLVELDAVEDARKIELRFSKSPADDPEMRYLIKLEELLFASKEDTSPRVKKAYDIAKGSFGGSASATRLGHLYQTLDKSFSATRGQWKTYDTSNGLPNNWVSAIAQDERGILWIGTGTGVCQYDGVSFIPFNISEELGYEVSCILIDKRGHLWIGYFDSRGAFYYDGEKLTHYTVEDGLTGNNIWKILQARDDSIWFACGSGGISRYDGKTFTNFTTKDGLVGNEANTIIEDSRGALWIGTNGGVSRYDGKTFTNLTEADGLVGNSVYAILEDPEGVFWFSTNKGASRYNFSTALPTQSKDETKFTNFTKKEGFTDSGNPFSNIIKDHDGNLWFTASGEGVFCYDGKTFVNFTDRDGLPGNYIFCAFVDREGNLWFGHNLGNGLSKFNPRGIKSYSVQDGLAGPAVYSIAMDSEGDLWIATDKGICKYDSSGGFTQPIADSRRVLGPVWTIFADSKHNLWFGTGAWTDVSTREDIFNRERGLIRFDGKSYTRFTTLDGLISNQILSIMEDKSGNIWIGSGSGGFSQVGGVSRYDGKGFTSFTTADGLCHNDVWSLAEDRQGNIWIGTWWGGISRYDGTGFANFTKEDGLASNEVVSIFADTRGQIWIGTLAGLCKYDGESFIPLPQFAGRFVRKIIEDRNGYLWFAASNDGAIKTDGNAVAYITKAEGLPSNYAFCLQEDRDGNIWIGTGEGLAKYTPCNIPPLVHIKSITADKVYDNPTDVSLPYDTGYMRVSYLGVSLRTRPEAMQYFYQLQDVERAAGSFVERAAGSLMQNQPAAGSTDNWQGPTNERSVDYLDLKPGKYTFKVKAVDMDLNYSEPASVSIVIPAPPFYRAGAFILALSITGGASLAGVATLGARLWRKSRAEKTRLQQELDDAHDMQTNLLPGSAPLVEGFDIAGFCHPAREVGGDFYDYLSLGDGKMGIALADVSDKGLKAAMNAVLVNGMLHEVTKVEASCGGILSALNTDLCPRMERRMFTAFEFAILDHDTMQWANAAQPYPMIRRDGQVSELKSEGEFPLGMMRNTAYSDCKLELQTGDIVIFYTDGIIEAGNEAEEMYGTERLEQAIARIDPAMNAEEVTRAISQNVTDFVGGAEQYDDMTVVVVKKL